MSSKIMGMPQVGVGCMWVGQDGDYVHVHYAVTNTIPVSQTQTHFMSLTCYVSVHTTSELSIINGAPFIGKEL
jgi:hypothetical protein